MLLLIQLDNSGKNFKAQISRVKESGMPADEKEETSLPRPPTLAKLIFFSLKALENQKNKTAFEYP